MMEPIISDTSFLFWWAFINSCAVAFIGHAYVKMKVGIAENNMNLKVKLLEQKYEELRSDFMFHRKGKYEHGNKALQLQIDKLRSVVFDEDGNCRVVTNEEMVVNDLVLKTAQDDESTVNGIVRTQEEMGNIVMDEIKKTFSEPENFKIVKPEIEK